MFVNAFDAGYVRLPHTISCEQFQPTHGNVDGFGNILIGDFAGPGAQGIPSPCGKFRRMHYIYPLACGHGWPIGLFYKFVGVNHTNL